MVGDEIDGAPSHPLGALSARTRAILIWSGVAVLLVLAFIAAAGAMQRTFYSASGFVSSYVGALSRHDLAAAMTMPGANPTAASLRAQGLPAAPSRELLRTDVIPRLQDVRVVSDDELGSGEHLVEVRATANGHPVAARFSVRQTGSVLGFLPTWRFAQTPLAVAHVTVQHADTFTIAGHTVEPRAITGEPAGAFTASADYLVFAPGVYELGHTSRYLDAQPAVFTADSPGRVVPVDVVANPNAAFVAQVDKQLHTYLDGCAKQQVLQPAGCPFGVSIDDRVLGLPTWSIAAYPPVAIVAGESSWTMPPSDGTAHLSVKVQSLFDGTIEQRESDEPFQMSISAITIYDDGALDITVAD
ncbi:hypothetical protein [Leifsonia sp. NPDC058230]|uniref:hypothetical protein n=1 Tax=Leifsonia sp. NPDC058230 TaxID=3346391 RepID=UPI0036D9C088